ncbi:MAG TPA: PBP1A family penicillin-binding protein [Longimicrobiales bacterium]|nr:PBP1A family penicillin-binding protein [Longimicrobiales bacterium]
MAEESGRRWLRRRPARRDDAGSVARSGNRPWQWLRAHRERVLAGMAIFIVVLGLLWERCGVAGCPNVERLNSYQPGGATILLDADGAQFADLAPIDHAVISLDSLPDHVPAAFIAVEDKRFYEHNGVDYRRVIGAALADIRAGGFVQGFSTITMQLARNVWPERLPGQNRTLRRKILEVRVARDIEDRYEKDEILELYLNHIYFGGGSYGIEAASRNYFRKPASRLTLAEAALLAAMPKSPTRYNPRRFTERARDRRDLVLSLMAEQGAASADDVAEARTSGLGVGSEPPARRDSAVTAPYFVEATRRILEDRFGEGVYTSALRVHTTLVRAAQRTAEEELERQLRRIERGVFGEYDGGRYRASEPPSAGIDYVQGAFVLMEAATGDVQALVGGRDFRHSRFDRATQARRQAGSAFKPFVFAAAIEDGYAPSQLVSDSVLRLELTGGEVWEPHNIGGEFEGTVTIREALVRSKNVPTIRLAADVGLNDVTSLARRAGIRSELPSVPSIAIGTAGVTALELTAAYTPFARLGTAVAPRFVTRVEDVDGRVVWEQKVRPREVVDSAVAFLITDMLEEAVEHGTARDVRRAGFTGPAAGKTGTTDDGADAWFVGYTTSHVATVWIGFDRPRPILDDATGGRLAAPVWARVMREHATAGGWRTPSTVAQHPVDPESGLLLVEGCEPDRGEGRIELFVRGDEPASACPQGVPEVHERGLLSRVGAWFGRQWRGFSRWVTRHFGTEEPQRAPREGDYLGVPRLPRAAELSEPQVEPDTFKRPLGVPIPEEPLADTVGDSIPPDSMGLLRDTIRLDTLVLPVRDSIRPPVRDTLPPVRPPPPDTTVAGASR